MHRVYVLYTECSNLTKPANHDTPQRVTLNGSSVHSTPQAKQNTPFTITHMTTPHTYTYSKPPSHNATHILTDCALLFESTESSVHHTPATETDRPTEIQETFVRENVHFSCATSSLALNCSNITTSAILLCSAAKLFSDEVNKRGSSSTRPTPRRLHTFHRTMAAHVRSLCYTKSALCARRSSVSRRYALHTSVPGASRKEAPGRFGKLNGRWIGV